MIISRIFKWNMRTCYCFRPGPHIPFKYAHHNHLCFPMMEKYLSKRSLIKHSCLWRDRLIVLWKTEQTSENIFTNKKSHFRFFCLLFYSVIRDCSDMTSSRKERCWRGRGFCEILISFVFLDNLFLFLTMGEGVKFLDL